MSRPQAVGVMLIALGLIYALLYAAWLRKRRSNTSAAVVVAEPRAEAGSAADEVPGSVVRAEGTYISTTTAASRLERVAVEGLGNRSRAIVAIRRGSPDELIRFERQGESDVVIPRSRLVDVRRDRGMAGKFVGANRLLVVRWKADDEAIYETGFLPRHRADLERLESALWWHQAGSSITPDQPAHAAGEPAQTPEAQTTEAQTTDESARPADVQNAQSTDVQNPEGDPRT